MAIDLDELRAMLKAVDLDVPEERLPGLLAELNSVLEASQAIRSETTSIPVPVTFDPAWSPRK